MQEKIKKSKEKQPVKYDVLEEEVSVAVMGGVRTVRHSLQSSGIEPGQMAAIFRRADEGDATAYLELAEQIEEKDPHYMSILGTRKRAVSQLEITVKPASDSVEDMDNAELVEDFISSGVLQRVMFDMLDAVGKGYSVIENVWSLSSLRWKITDLIRRDPKWYVFDRIDGETLRLKSETGIEQDLEPYKYTIHYHKAKSGLPIRGGVIRTCAWFWLFKNFSIKDWIVFAEAYGQPIRIGKYGAGASEADKAVLMKAIRKIGSDFGAIIPDTMMIEFIESQGKTASTDMFERLCRYCDEQMSKAVLGQTTTTDALSSGLAGNQAHDEVRTDISLADGKQLAETINRYIIQPLIALNKGEQENYPHIDIGLTESVDIEKIATVTSTMVNAGAKISMKKTLERLGLPMAETEEDTLKPSQVQPTQSFMSARPLRVLAAASSSRDAIDTLSDEMADEWQEMLNPLMEAIEAAIEKADTKEELEQILLDLSSKLDISPAAERLAKAAFSARMAGNLGAKLS